MAYVRSSEAAGRRCALAAAVDPDDGDREAGRRAVVVGGGKVGKVGSTALGITMGMWNVLANDSIAAIVKWLATPSIAKIPLATVMHSTTKHSISCIIIIIIIIIIEILHEVHS